MLIKMVNIGEAGVTKYIGQLMKLIEENSNELVCVARINDGNDNYSFMAIFKSKCTIGEYSACLHAWGTNDAKSGEGGRGFIRMNEYLKENSIKTVDLVLSEIDNEKIGYSGTLFTGTEESDSIWAKYANAIFRTFY